MNPFIDDDSTNPFHDDDKESSNPFDSPDGNANLLDSHNENINPFETPNDSSNPFDTPKDDTENVDTMNPFDNQVGGKIISTSNNPFDKHNNDENNPFNDSKKFSNNPFEDNSNIKTQNANQNNMKSDNVNKNNNKSSTSGISILNILKSPPKPEQTFKSSTSIFSELKNKGEKQWKKGIDKDYDKSLHNQNTDSNSKWKDIVKKSILPKIHEDKKNIFDKINESKLADEILPNINIEFDFDVNLHLDSVFSAPNTIISQLMKKYKADVGDDDNNDINDVENNDNLLEETAPISRKSQPAESMRRERLDGSILKSNLSEPIKNSRLYQYCDQLNLLPVIKDSRSNKYTLKDSLNFTFLSKLSRGILKNDESEILQLNQPSFTISDLKETTENMSKHYQQSLRKHTQCVEFNLDEYNYYLITNTNFDLSSGGLFFHYLQSQIQKRRLEINLESFVFLCISCYNIGLENISGYPYQRYINIFDEKNDQVHIQNTQIELLKLLMEFRNLSQLTIVSDQEKYEYKNMSFYFYMFDQLRSIILSKCTPNFCQFIYTLNRSLFKIACYQCPFNSIKELLDSLKTKEKWQYLRKLTINKANISDIDSSLTLCPNLNYLDLSYNKINIISRVDKLPLTQLLLSHNNIVDSISGKWYELPQTLIKLNISHNFISQVDWVRDYPNLNKINLSYNLVQSSPHSLPNQMIDLYGNPFPTIDDKILGDFLYNDPENMVDSNHISQFNHDANEIREDRVNRNDFDHTQIHLPTSNVDESMTLLKRELDLFLESQSSVEVYLFDEKYKDPTDSLGSLIKFQQFCHNIKDNSFVYRTEKNYDSATISKLKLNPPTSIDNDFTESNDINPVARAMQYLRSVEYMIQYSYRDYGFILSISSNIVREYSLESDGKLLHQWDLLDMTKCIIKQRPLGISVLLNDGQQLFYGTSDLEDFEIIYSIFYGYMNQINGVKKALQCNGCGDEFTEIEKLETFRCKCHSKSFRIIFSEPIQTEERDSKIYDTGNNGNVSGIIEQPQFQINIIENYFAYPT